MKSIRMILPLIGNLCFMIIDFPGHPILYYLLSFGFCVLKEDWSSDIVYWKKKNEKKQQKNVHAKMYSGFSKSLNQASL